MNRYIISRIGAIALIPLLFLAAEQKSPSNDTVAMPSPSLVDSNTLLKVPSKKIEIPSPQSTPLAVASPSTTPLAESSPQASATRSPEDYPVTQSSPENQKLPAASSLPNLTHPSPTSNDLSEALLSDELPASSATKASLPSSTEARTSHLSLAKQLSSESTSPLVTPTITSQKKVFAPAAESTNTPNDKVSIQFPHTSVIEVLSLYEKLTGKHIIRDSNLAGPELSIMINDPVSKKDAISLLESSMLLNGYILVPIDDKTVKILGPSHPPRMEGLPLYQDEVELPKEGEQLVSFYTPLHFLSPNEAINVLQGVIQVNPYGSLVAVPNTSAIVITDKTPVVRKALALLEVIDHEPSQIITEFVPLQRANAEKIVETLNQVFGKDPSSSPSTSPSKPSQPPSSQTGSVTTGNEDDQHILSGKAQFIADKRTNRVLLITRAENYRYVRELIAKLDQAVQFEEPLVRPLNYMSTGDVFPVLVQMLKSKDDDTSTNNTASPQATPQNPMNNSSNAGGGTNGSGGSNPADRLSNAQLQPPQSALIGSTSLIGDPTGNSIIVYGPPESKSKAAQIINLLDKRPQQVYLAAVIGQMKLDESTDFGSAYLFHYKGFNTLLSGGGFSAPVAAAGTALDTLGNAAASAGGLTAFGAIAGSLDVYANFLETTGKFRTIARPVVYTSNNRKATIFSGKSVPYNSSTLNSVVAGSSATNTANSIQANITYQDVTLKLEVIPLINSDNEINLLISQQNKTIDQVASSLYAKQGIQAPVINTQELNTSVRIPSGSTIVLGGLIEEDKTEKQAGVPYLNKIPVLGPLLGGHTNKEKTRTELIVMIQPIIVDSNFNMGQTSKKQGGTSDLGKEAQEFEKKLQPTPTPLPKKKKFQLFPQPKLKNF